MKRNDFIQIKTLDEKALAAKAGEIRAEVADLIMDKNMGKLKDIKTVMKKKRDLARVLTVLRQKQLIGELTDDSLKITSQNEEMKKEKEVK